MRKTIRAALMAVAMTAFGATSALAQNTKPLEVIVFPGGFNWPIWVAQDKGFFEKNGIGVKVVPTPNSQFQLKNLIEGKFDIAMTAIDNVIAYTEGQGATKVDVQPDIFAFMGGDNGFLRLVATPNVTDAGLKTLADIPHLEDLTLRYTGMTPTGLKSLKRLKNLRTLAVNGPSKDPVTDDQIDDLKRSLPDCRVTR